MQDESTARGALVLWPAEALKLFELGHQIPPTCHKEGWAKEPLPPQAEYHNTHKDPQLDKTIKAHKASGDCDTSKTGGEPDNLTRKIPKPDCVPALDELLSQ